MCDWFFEAPFAFQHFSQRHVMNASEFCEHVPGILHVTKMVYSCSFSSFDSVTCWLQLQFGKVFKQVLNVKHARALLV